MAVYRFGSFQLDTLLLELRQNGRALRVQRRVFDLVRYLVENRDRVVTRRELRDNVWAGIAVEESSLYRAVALARRLLGSGESIQLVRGRGYRFALEVSEGPDSPVPRSLFVGRRSSLLRLDDAFSPAPHRGSIVFVTGEAGIGKTSLVEQWLRELRRTTRADIAFGQCHELRDAQEPYRPLLDALTGLVDQAGRRDLTQVLRARAPAWLGQLPDLSSASDRDASARRIADLDRSRMAREFGDAMRELTRRRPLVLVIEDLQWSDPSTLHVLEACATAREPTGMHIVATCRSGDPTESSQAADLLTRLRAKHETTELALEGLSHAELRSYLEERFGSGDLPEPLVCWLAARSSGNPLLLAQLAETLLERERVAVRDGSVRLCVGLEALDREIPRGIAELVRRQLELLGPETRELVESASVVGISGSAALIAAGVDRDFTDPAVLEQTEDALDVVAGEGRLLRHEGVEEWPDGTISTTYSFRHSLHRDIVYAEMRASRRVRCHRQVGAAMEKGFTRELDSVASRLAFHFERGHERERALSHLIRAIRMAARRYARDEAYATATHALELIEDLEPEVRDHLEREIRLSVAPALSRNPAHPDTDVNYVRCEELCRKSGDVRSLCTVLWGRSYFAYQHQRHDEALEFARELLRAAEPLEDPFFVVLAQDSLARSDLALCDFERALVHADEALAVCSGDLQEELIEYVGQDVGTSSGIISAFALWHMGSVGAALERMSETVSGAASLDHSYTYAAALCYAALFYHGTRDREAARGAAEQAIAVAERGGHAQEATFARIVRAASLPCDEDRLAQLQLALGQAATAGEATNAAMAVGVGVFYAEALLAVGEMEQARDVATAGLAGVAAVGERLLEPSYRYVEAQALMKPMERIEKLHEARRLANSLGLRVLELEIARSLALELRGCGRPDEAGALLAPLVRRFQGEPPVRVLQLARSLLDELS